MDGAVQFPPELRQYKPYVDSYVSGKLRQFGTILARQLNPNLSKDHVKRLVDDTMVIMAQQDAAATPQRPLRLVIRHDCQSSGCGDASCVLCQYNPSRLCTRNVKQKYLIDDHLKAKCGAPLRVELVDDTGACHTEGLPPGVQLEMHVLNGEKYKELCPDNSLLSTSAIRSCIIAHHSKALLRREGMGEDQLRVYLPLERGAAAVSDLALTTSSEALLSGKAPTFRLLVWAVEANGDPVPYVTYVVSESFVVATKRVKHAIKADVPSITDHISKLLHIGKATVDKLQDLRTAFQEEGFDAKLPESLVRVERVGQFRQLVEMSESSNDLKNKLRHVLKLSPEKWDEVCQHALGAVVPDFRNRVWWYPPLQLGLLYACKNGAIQMDSPIAIVRVGPPDGAHSVVPLQSLPPADFNAVPRLKQTAVTNWYMANHPNWAIYNDGSVDDGGMLPPAGPPPGPQVYYQAPPPQVGPTGLMAPGPGGPGPYGPDMYGGPGAYGGPADGGVYGGGMGQAAMAAAQMGLPPHGGLAPPPAAHRGSNSSPFALMQQPPPQGQPAQTGSQGAPQAAGSRGGSEQSGSGAASTGMAGGGMRGGGGGHAHMSAASGPPQPGPPADSFGSMAHRASAFAAANTILADIGDAFPAFPGAPGGGAGQRGGPGGASAGGAPPHDALPVGPGGGGPGSLGFPGGSSLMGAMGQGGLGPLDVELKTEVLFERGMSAMLGVPGLQSLTANDTFRSNDWLQPLGGGGGGGGAGGPSGVEDSLMGTASYTMLDVGPPPNDMGLGPGGGSELLADGPVGGDGGGAGAAAQRGRGGAGGGGGGPALGGMDPERRLSLKLNSMSLDLEQVMADHVGS